MDWVEYIRAAILALDQEIPTLEGYERERACAARELLVSSLPEAHDDT